MRTPMTGRSSERGIALVLVLFMILVLSVLGSSLIFISRTETMSTLNYKTMSQTRYAAESAVHSAANYLLWSYAAPSGTASLSSFDTLQSPVRYSGSNVYLTSRSGESSHYPGSTVPAAFLNASHGSLNLSNGAVAYDAQATLLSMRSFTDAMTGLPTTIQTWEIVGRGVVRGAASAQVEVAAILERQDVPLYKYAAFATANGCNALSFAGGGTTDSYDSGALVGGVPVIANNTGNVGSNGNLTETGDPTTINGSLSTPRTGVGTCTTGNITAQTSIDGATVEGGIVELPQALSYPSPPAISPLPPTNNVAFGSGCPGGILYCTASAGGATLTPPGSSSVVQLGNVNMGSFDILHLNAGIYEINSISMTSHSQLVVDSGPVIIKVAGTGVTMPIRLEGNAVSNPTFNSANLQFLYGGTGQVRLRGNADFAALVYAPNAETSFAGQGDFFGAVVTRTLTSTGGANIHYDRRLQRDGFTLGNPVLNSFTWKSY